MTNRSYVIETDGLTRGFGARKVVEQLNLRVPSGGIYGFLGPNGAGKTTTIRMLLGLIRPDSGSVRIFGERFSRRALSRIGSLVEAPSLYPHLTGFENLEVNRRLVGEAPASIGRALAIVRLTRDADRLVREYSLGMRQRLGIALALLNSPDLLILDEPTNGLDPAGIHEMRDLLRRMPVEHGVTVFVSSHLLNEVEQIAGSIGIICDGEMRFQGPLADLRELHAGRITIRVSRTEPALQCLRASGINASCDATNMLCVPGKQEDATRINRLLLENGHVAFHLSAEDESLEEIFLSLTRGRVQ